MRLMSLFITVGLGLFAQVDLDDDKSTSLKQFSAINRAFSVSRDLTVSDARKQLERRMETSPPEDIPLRDELAQRYNELPPFYLFNLSERAFSADIREALEWYWLGHIRAGLDAALCADTTAVDAVASLPTRARTVAQYIRVNPKVAGEVGETALNRLDLYDSQVSPWWICSRGTNAKTAKADDHSLSWIVSEDEMVTRYAELIMEMRELFGQMKQPMEDRVPSFSPAITPTTVLSRRNITNVLWSRTRGLVLTESVLRKPARLLVWNGLGVTTVADDVGGPFICIAGDFVSYRTRTPRAPGPRPTHDVTDPKILRYKAGVLGQGLQSYSEQYFTDGKSAGIPPGVSLEVSPGISSGISPGGFQRGRVNDLEFTNWNQSSLTCRWRQSGEIDAARYDAAQTVALGSGRGFLESTSDGTFHYASTLAPPVKVSEKQYPLKCLKFVPFLNAINMVACPIFYISPDGDELNRALLGVSLMKFGGSAPQIEEQPLPLIHGERGETQTLVTKAGIIRLMKSRYTPVRKRPGGLYWFGWSPDHEPKKIWEGYPDQADVSDDGCKVAFSTIKSVASIGRERNVLVIDVCTDLMN